MEYLDKPRLSTTDLWTSSFNATNRAKYTSRFVYPIGSIADFGESNPVRQILADSWMVNIEELNWDFDYAPPQLYSKYDTLLCLEVIEHLYNPLLFLEHVKTFMKPRASLYISTPYQWPPLLISEHHFHEIPESRLLWLFDKVKLKVIRKGSVSIRNKLPHHLRGIRPFMRFFQKTRIYELQTR